MMKKNQERFTLRVSVVAVRGALIAMALTPIALHVHAEETTVAEATAVTSTVEIGVGDVSQGSYKAGEYNGLQENGLYLNGNIDLRGGDPETAKRWSITGTDLGLQNRNLSVEYGEQGKFRFNFGYDELRRNRSDTYQTPYRGAGTNNLQLPSNWVIPVVPAAFDAGAPPPSPPADARGLSSTVAASNTVVGGVLTAPSGANLAESNNIIANDVPAFQRFNLYTTRAKSDFAFSYLLDPQWGVKFRYRHEDKDGYKPMGAITKAANDGVSTILPDKIDQTTEQFNLSLNYKEGKQFLQAAYYGSLFKNHVPSMSWQNWSDPTGALGDATSTISSAPSNEFHKFSLTGGYNFSSTTKLVMNGSYSRSTQNDPFLTDTGTPLVPVSSLNALVVTEGLNVKLTAKPVKESNVAVAYKYEKRDNRTPVNTYGFYDANQPASGTPADANFLAALGPAAAALSDNININANRPYSKTTNQLNLDGDYRVAKGQVVKVGYDWQKIDRYCTGTWISCVDADSTTENTLRTEWRANLLENLNGKIGYAYSERKVSDYNENAFLALVPMANVIPTGGATASAYATMQALGLTGYGPALGALPAPTGNQAFYFADNNMLNSALYANQNVISELPGMRRFNMADRNRDKWRSSLDWQANEQLSLQGGVNFNRDNYANSTYGLKEAKSWALNLDGTYTLDENLTVSVFYSYEDQRSKSAGSTLDFANDPTGVTIPAGCPTLAAGTVNANGKVDPCNNWSTDMHDQIDTLGFAFKQKGLLHDRLELDGNLVFTRARTDIGVTGGMYVTDPFAVVAAYYIPAAAVPTVSTNTIELKLSGRYTIDKSQAVRVGYSYWHMKSTDYAYDGMQYGGLSNVLPTNEQAPNYSVSAVGVSYIYTFH
jgi:MtrB/PioB family decaheme-associated outer membrane protein